VVGHPSIQFQSFSFLDRHLVAISSTTHAMLHVTCVHLKKKNIDLRQVALEVGEMYAKERVHVQSSPEFSQGSICFSALHLQMRFDWCRDDHFASIKLL
jgi:hypothetical protein